MRKYNLMYAALVAAAAVLVGSNAWATSQWSTEAAARVVGNQIAAYLDDPTAGNVNATDNAAGRLPTPLDQNLIDLIFEVAASHGLSAAQAMQTLQEMALLAGSGSDLAAVSDQFTPPECPCDLGPGSMEACREIERDGVIFIRFCQSGGPFTRDSIEVVLQEGIYSCKGVYFVEEKPISKTEAGACVAIINSLCGFDGTCPVSNLP